MKLTSSAQTKLELIKAAIERGSKLFNRDDIFISPIISVTNQDNNDLCDGLWDPCLEVKDGNLVLIGSEGCSGFGYTAKITLSLDNFEVVDISAVANNTPTRTHYKSVEGFIKDVKNCFLENIDVAWSCEIEEINAKLSPEDKELFEKLYN